MLPQLAGKKEASLLPLATTLAESCCPPWRGWLSLPRTERHPLLKLQGWQSGWQLLQMPQLGPSPGDAQSHRLAAPASPPVRCHLVLGRVWLSLFTCVQPAQSQPTGTGTGLSDITPLRPAPPPTAESVMSHSLCVAASPLVPRRPHLSSRQPPRSSRQDKPRPDHILRGGQFCSSWDPMQHETGLASNLEKTSGCRNEEQMPRQTKGRNGQCGRRVTEHAADWTRRVRRGGRTRGSC